MVTKYKVQGRKVLVSVGGAAFTPQLTTQSDADNYVKNIEAIINQYGFEGIDLDIESGARVDSSSKNLKIAGT